MRTVRRHVTLTCVAISALALTACLPGGDPERASIESIMGMDEAAWNPENQQAQETLLQGAIATCMARQGWEYIPVSYPDNVEGLTDENEEERIKREGLGIAYWTLHPSADPFYDDPWLDFVDPNQAITDALSEPDLTEYYEALFGSGGGCQGEAYATIDDGAPSDGDEYWQAVSVFYEELNGRIEADPRLAGIAAEWANCMSSGGFEYTSRDLFWETSSVEFQRRHDDILGPDYYADPFEGWAGADIDEFFATASQAEIEALFNQQANLTDAQRSQLEALLAEEVEIALANFRCEQRIRDTEQDLYAQIEEAYAEEHRAELEQLAASLRADS